MFERITQSFYTNIVRAGDTVIDGGAHTGRHTIPLARVVGPDGMVIAFEPLIAAADKLRLLLARFGFDRRVRLQVEALSSEPGRRDFFVVNNMPEFSGLKSRTYVDFVPDHTKVQVDVDDHRFRPGSPCGHQGSCRSSSSISRAASFARFKGRNRRCDLTGRAACSRMAWSPARTTTRQASSSVTSSASTTSSTTSSGSPVDETRWSQSGPVVLRGHATCAQPRTGFLSCGPRCSRNF